MLESGLMFFDCEIVKPLAENNVFQSYLVSCPDISSVKLFRIFSDHIFQQKNHHHFLDQAHWLSSQTFPGVGTPVRAGEIDNQLVCLYPLPPGEVLNRIVVEDFSVRRAAELVAKILQHLIVPHSAGLVHGNLSPETIYIHNDVPYLADFALSQLIKLDYQSGIDPHYTSPEQVRGEVPDPAADIYSLGCIFYYLLTHRPTFAGNDAFTIAMQHLQEVFPRLPDSLQVCQVLLDSMTNISPAKRMEAGPLLDEIKQWIDSGLLDSLPSAPLSEPKKTETAKIDNFLQREEMAKIEQSALAAQVEARLKEHAIVADESMSLENIQDGSPDGTEGLEPIYLKEKTRMWRYFLILIIGILIGSGSYFLFFNGSFPAPVKISNNNLSVALDYALSLWQKADLAAAEVEFRKIIAQYPEDPRAYNNLAAIYAAQGQYDPAREQLEHALKTSDHYATVYNNLAAIYAEMARDSYGKALQIDNAHSQINLMVISNKGIDVSPVSANVTVKKKPDESTERQNIQTAALKKVQTNTENNGGPAMAVKVADITAGILIEKEAQVTPLMAVADTAHMDKNVAIESTAQEKLLISEEDKTSQIVTHTESAKEFMTRWAQSWSNQDVPAYLTFYDAEFIPGGGKIRVDWEAERYERIKSPQKITVTLTDVKTSEQNDHRLRFEATQIYISDVYSDRTKKVFDLQKKENGWSILRERSLGSVR